MHGHMVVKFIYFVRGLGADIRSHRDGGTDGHGFTQCFALLCAALLDTGAGDC